MRKTIFTSVTLFLFSFTAFSQKWAVETNALDWANYGTANLSASRGINRYCAAVAGVRFNPWKFKDSEGASHQNRALTANLGVCFWPWHIYSGWWFSSKIQAEQFSRGNILSLKELQEGYAAGVSISAGYALMAGKRWNISFGLGGWGGYMKSSLYRCPDCGRKLSENRGLFFLPDNDTKVAVMYVF